MSSRIYHYTSIESLALILKTKKLRFTRLDKVDDIREAQKHVGINFGKYFFVSCWTKQKTESIPQWNMYSREMQGVRIELPEYPFDSIQLNRDSGTHGISWDGEVISPIEIEQFFGDSYFIVPTFLNRKDFAGPVDYVEDVEGLYSKSIIRHVDDFGKEILTIDGIPKLPRLKMKDWGFQDEYRFSLFVMPSVQMTDDAECTTNQKSFKWWASLGNALLNNIDTGVNHIDIPLNPLVFNDMSIRLGPLCTPGGKICIEALLNQFAPNARLENSALAGTIRTKG